MTIEQLLEALPQSVMVHDRSYYLHIGKFGRKYEISYRARNDNGYSDEFYNLGTLRDSLEAVYQDLKDNNLL